MSDSPAVSVIIPAYGHADLIGETLDSVLAQTFDDYEIIVIDDGSPDDTAGAVEAVSRRSPRPIRYERQENRGQGGARNVGLKLARGEFVAYLDDDDLWPADKLEWQIECLRRDDQLGLVWGEHSVLLPDGGEFHHQPRFVDMPEGEAHAAFLYKNRIMSPGQTLIRRSALERVGGFDESIWGADDWDLYLRLAKVTTFAFDPRLALRYREHARNASRRAVEHAANHRAVIRRHVGRNPLSYWPAVWRGRSYYLPRLLAAGERAEAESRHQDAVAAYLSALKYRPALALRPWRVWALVRSGLRAVARS